MKRLLALLLPASLLAALAFAAPAPAAVDMFLKASGMQGESQDSQMAKAADVLEFSWGVHRARATRTRPAQPRFADMSVTKYVDTMSPPLLTSAATGEPISSVVLYVPGPASTRRRRISSSA